MEKTDYEVKGLWFANKSTRGDTEPYTVYSGGSRSGWRGSWLEAIDEQDKVGIQATPEELVGLTYKPYLLVPLEML